MSTCFLSLLTTHYGIYLNRFMKLALCWSRASAFFSPSRSSIWAHFLTQIPKSHRFVARKSLCHHGNSCWAFSQFFLSHDLRTGRNLVMCCIQFDELLPLNTLACRWVDRCYISLARGIITLSETELK